MQDSIMGVSLIFSYLVALFGCQGHGLWGALFNGSMMTLQTHVCTMIDRIYNIHTIYGYLHSLQVKSLGYYERELI